MTTRTKDYSAWHEHKDFIHKLYILEKKSQEDVLDIITKPPYGHLSKRVLRSTAALAKSPISLHFTMPFSMLKSTRSVICYRKERGLDNGSKLPANPYLKSVLGNVQRNASGLGIKRSPQEFRYSNCSRKWGLRQTTSPRAATFPPQTSLLM